MTIIKSALMIPAFVSSLWVMNTGPLEPDIRNQDPNLVLATVPNSATSSEARVSDRKAGLQELEKEVIARRLRIERILVTLNRVAEAAMQMSPDRAASIEPVLSDIAEDTLELTSEDAVFNNDTDKALTNLESTVSELVDAVAKVVEPEMSL